MRMVKMVVEKASETNERNWHKIQNALLVKREREREREQSIMRMGTFTEAR